jgi:hypothetical protein
MTIYQSLNIFEAKVVSIKGTELFLIIQNNTLIVKIHNFIFS